MLCLKELINGSKNALSESQEKINSLKIEQEQLLIKLEEINSLIQLEEANSAQLPKTVEEKKKEMIAKYNKLMVIQSQKDKTVLGSADEDNRLIAPHRKGRSSTQDDDLRLTAQLGARRKTLGDILKIA